MIVNYIQGLKKPLESGTNNILVGGAGSGYWVDFFRLFHAVGLFD